MEIVKETPKLVTQESAVEDRLMEAMLSGEAQRDVYADLQSNGYKISAAAFKDIRTKFYRKVEKRLRTDPITAFINMLDNHNDTYRRIMKKINQIREDIAIADDRSRNKLIGMLVKNMNHALASLEAKEKRVQMTHRTHRMRVSHPEEVSAYIASMLTVDASLDVENWHFDQPIADLDKIDQLLKTVENEDTLFQEVTIDAGDTSEGELEVEMMETTKQIQSKAQGVHRVDSTMIAQNNSEDIADKLDSLFDKD